MTSSVTLLEATYGLPAQVRVVKDDHVRVLSFSVGHVFTDNSNAQAYAAETAQALGCSVERES